MKIEITDPTEIHLLLVEKYQKSTVNIVIRAVIDECFSDDVYASALNSLVKKHPYLTAKYTSESDSGESRYFYEESNSVTASLNITRMKDESIDREINVLSPMRSHLFKTNDGMLHHLNIYVGESKSLLELACPHIVGEIPSIIILMGDLLKNIDQQSGAGHDEILKNEKYYFNEADFSWQTCVYENLNFETDKADKLETDPWILPKATLERHKLDPSYFKKINSWLINNNIPAKASDVFYYIAHQVLTGILDASPDMWLILSYRNNALNKKIKNSIYNFAFFAPVNTSVFDGGSQKEWLSSICSYRQNLISREGVCASRNFFYSLNKAMQGKDIQTGKNIMDALVKFPDFAFNNFGKIDSYVGTHERFNIIDFDVQDGTPVQEIRYFSLGETFYINPTFFEKSGVDVKIFWHEFEENLVGILG